MSNTSTDKRIDNLLAMGQQFINEATELRKGLAGHSRASRKGLSVEQKSKLITRRNKTAFRIK